MNWSSGSNFEAKGLKIKKKNKIWKIRVDFSFNIFYEYDIDKENLKDIYKYSLIVSLY